MHNTIAIISILNHKSVSHSINQHKPHHSNHTKNALSIQSIVSIKTIMKPYQCLSDRSEPIECRSGTCFSIQQPFISSNKNLHDFVHCTCPVLIQPTYVCALAHYSPRTPQKLGFLKLRDFFHQDLQYCRKFDASMRSSSHSLSQNRYSIMLKRSTPKILSQEALHQYSKIYSHKKLSIDPQKG
jgi:hypothetical protein